MKKAVVIILALSLSFVLFACDNNSNSTLTETTQKIAETVADVVGTSVKADTVKDLHALSATASQSESEICAEPRKSTLAAADFAFKMLGEAIDDEENALISPVSLITALSMTATAQRTKRLNRLKAFWARRSTH